MGEQIYLWPAKAGVKSGLAGIEVGFWAAPKLIALANNMRPLRKPSMRHPTSEASRQRFESRSAKAIRIAATMHALSSLSTQTSLEEESAPATGLPRRFEHGSGTTQESYAEAVRQQLSPKPEQEESLPTPETGEPLRQV
jgi:hypothetical protein